ncbi:hypothetical protein F8388_017637 [Cannabis sativa]|uniref:Reverse transcriptase zinc-binding domain-containing protein n=1 Tax=Cannabis sativa TaxID=3483 RepID=A0A7J6DVV6_CANSA|nr:hypothetical protein F8388_017637 [Cannabis sativa]
MAARDILRNEACYLIGNGNSVDVWNSPWVPWINWQQSRATFNPLIQQKSVYASSLIRDDGEWNLDLVRRWFVPTLASSINLITRLPGGYVDRLIWKDSTAGLFSTKEAYKAIIRRRLGVKDKTWSDLWKSPQQERRLGRDILPFGNRLKMIFGNSETCYICKADDDSFIHLFCKCPLAKALWFDSVWSVRSENLRFDTPLELLKWILNPDFLSQNPVEDQRQFTLFASCLCFVLWQTRNSAYHEQTVPTFAGIRSEIWSRIRDTNHAFSVEIPQPVESGSGTLPHDIYLDRIMFFTDAACRGLVGAGGIIEAEARTLLHACNWCSTRGWVNPIFFTDCKVLAESLSSKIIPSWKDNSLFIHLFEAFNVIPGAQVVWIKRDSNELAHRLVDWAFKYLAFSLNPIRTGNLFQAKEIRIRVTKHILGPPPNKGTAVVFDKVLASNVLHDFATALIFSTNYQNKS